MWALETQECLNELHAFRVNYIPAIEEELEAGRPLGEVLHELAQLYNETQEEKG